MWEGKFQDSIQEELLAYQLEYGVLINMGAMPPDTSLLGQLSALDPNDKGDLKRAKQLLTDESLVSKTARNVYSDLPLTPQSGVKGLYQNFYLTYDTARDNAPGPSWLWPSIPTPGELSSPKYWLKKLF